MKSNLTEDSLRQFLSNMQVDVTLVNYHQLDASWKREEYVHNFNRMFFIVGGEGRIEVNGHVYFPEPGQLVVMPCNVRQSYTAINDNAFSKYWCHFTSRVGSRDLFELYNFPVCVNISDSQQVIQLFRHMLSNKELKKPTSLLSIRAAMLELIGLFIENGLHQTNTLMVTTKKMDIVLQFIEKNLDERITIDQLAQLVHYHPNYFIRSFHTILGCSPIQYINRLRLEKARQLLATDIPIGSIARMVGIEQHNFSSMFKNYTGFPPSVFRRMMNS